MPGQKLKIGATLREARTSFEQNRALIIRLTVAFAALNAIASLFSVAGAAGPAVSLGITLLFGAAYGGLVTAVVCLPGKEESFGELWGKVGPVLARLIWVTLITAVAALAGLAILIFPGLIIATVWSVAGQAAVVERTGVFASLGRSFNLVRNTAWQVFGYLLLAALIGLLMFALAAIVSAPLPSGAIRTLVSTFLSNLLSTPVLAVATAQLYLSLTRSEKEPIADSPGSLGESESN